MWCEKGWRGPLTSSSPCGNVVRTEGSRKMGVSRQGFLGGPHGRSAARRQGNVRRRTWTRQRDERFVFNTCNEPSTEPTRRGPTVGSVPSGLEEVMVDRGAGVARRSGRPLDLSAQEVAVLLVLAGAGGRVVSRGELQRRAGLSDLAPRRCDSVIVGLRRVLGPGAIVTVRARGWRCSPSVGLTHAPSDVPA